MVTTTIETHSDIQTGILAAICERPRSVVSICTAMASENADKLCEIDQVVEVSREVRRMHEAGMISYDGYLIKKVRGRSAITSGQ